MKNPVGMSAWKTLIFSWSSLLSWCERSLMNPQIVLKRYELAEVA